MDRDESRRESVVTVTDLLPFPRSHIHGYRVWPGIGGEGWWRNRVWWERTQRKRDRYEESGEDMDKRGEEGWAERDEERESERNWNICPIFTFRFKHKSRPSLFSLFSFTHRMILNTYRCLSFPHLSFFPKAIYDFPLRLYSKDSESVGEGEGEEVTEKCTERDGREKVRAREKDVCVMEDDEKRKGRREGKPGKIWSTSQVLVLHRFPKRWKYQVVVQ